MPWYWILIILSAIVGPFEAMHALNKARSRAQARRKRDESQSGESGQRGDDEPGAAKQEGSGEEAPGRAGGLKGNSADE